MIHVYANVHYYSQRNDILALGILIFPYGSIQHPQIVAIYRCKANIPMATIKKKQAETDNKIPSEVCFP